MSNKPKGLPGRGAAGSCHSRMSRSLFHKFIEADRVLFFTGQLSISAKDKHILGLASGKIDVRKDILETGCHVETASFLEKLRG